MAKGLGSAKLPGDPGTTSPKLDGATQVGALSPARPPIPLIVDPSGETRGVGPYQVTGTLGRGGMGVVFEVVDTRNGKHYALKTIETRFLELPESAAEQRFKQEISVLERLDHPGVVRLYDTGFARHPMGYDLAFFVMERLDGEPLDHDIKKGRIFRLEDALGIVSQLTDALEYLGANGVLHRDIKPANIFRERAGRVVLMDFGLARSEELTRLTLAGQIVGTFGYMSPERLCGKKTSISSDIYALGVVLFQMLAGVHPFGAPSPTEMLEAIKRGVTFPARFDELPSAASVKALILSLLAYGMDDRPAPEVLKGRIDALLLELEESSPTAQPTNAQLLEHRRALESHAIPPAPTRTQALEERVTRPPARDRRAPAPQTAKVRRVEEADSALTPVHGDPEPSMPATVTPSPSGSAPLIAPAGSRGPTWATTGLLTSAAACVAFLAGLFIGRTQQPEVIMPLDADLAAAFARGQAAAKGVSQVPSATPRGPGAVAVEPETLPEEELDPAAVDDPSEAFSIGERLVEKRRHTSAIGFLNRALQLNPAHASAHRVLGDAYVGTADGPKAAHHYKLYLALRPGAADAALVRKALRSLTP